MNFEQWLAAHGYDAEKLTDQQRKHLAAAWKAETQPDPAPVPAASTVPTDKDGKGFRQKMDAIEAEGIRVEYIKTRTIQAAEQYKHDPDKVRKLNDLCEAAIADESVDAKTFDLQLLRFDRFTPNVITTRENGLTAEIVEAAVCKAGRLGSIEDRFDDKTLSAADKHFKNGVSLHRLIGLCARQNGWRGDDVKADLRNAMRCAFGYNGIQASVPGTSTLAISGILSNTANKFLVDAWNSVENTWRRITAVRSVNDFKTITSYSLTGDLTYDKVAPGGEIQHGTLGNETYTNRADTYAKLLGIDRRDLINDDLGAFTNVMKRLGRGGALKLNDVFWREFMADASTFYTTGRLNYDDGTDTAFTSDGLVAADIFWQAKTDPDGKPLGIPAKILLVPPAHRIPAKRLMSSQSTNKDTDLGSDNPWAGMFQVESSTYLANSNYTGYSALAWYMLADPNDLAVIETCFLNGNEMPTVEEVELAADHLGMAMRAYHDFGVTKQEYRAAYKFKGEA